MARIRSMHPELRTSETVAAWPREVRYAWALLWGYLDDHGRGLDSPRVIAADCFPLDDDVTGTVMAGWLDLFKASDCICRYEYDGKRYLHAVNWDDYQKPQHPGKMRIPPCPDHEPDEHRAWSEQCAPKRKARLTKVSRDSQESLVTDSPTSKEGEKELSKEGEGETRASATPTPPSTTPAPPPAPDIDIPPDRCGKHRHLERPPNCGRCKDARLARERAIAAAADRTHDDAAELLAARRAVPWCGDADCDQHDRRRITAGPNGNQGLSKCPRCHPDLVVGPVQPAAHLALVAG